MKNFALGKYVPYADWVHRLDPRVKIFTTILLMVTVFLPFDSWGMRFLMEGIVFLVATFLVFSSHVRLLSLLKSLRSLWFMVVFLLLIYILVPNNSHVLGVAWSINGWTVYWDAFAEAGRILLRIFLMIELTMVLTASTKPLDLTYALEWYLSPLKVFHFPAAAVAMTISIALRFIPTLLEDADRVMKAQSSRGVDFAHGPLIRRLAGYTSLIIPLFVSSFLRSGELANAMECRGYDPSAKRTRYRMLKFHWGDLFYTLFSVALLTGFILVSVFHYDVFAQWFGVYVP